MVWGPLSLDWGALLGPLNLITARLECKIKKEDAVILAKNKQINFNTFVIVIQVGSETSRD